MFGNVRSDFILDDQNLPTFLSVFGKCWLTWLVPFHSLWSIGPRKPGQLLDFIPCVACLGRLFVQRSPPVVCRTTLFSLPLWVPPQCMPSDIAVPFSEGFPYPTPFAPSNLDVDSFLFSSCPKSSFLVTSGQCMPMMDHRHRLVNVPVDYSVD